MINSILFVCMGNICRSPTAEAIFRRMIEQYQLSVTIDSAGTLDFHRGHAPDARSIDAGQKRGLSFAGMKARQVVTADFAHFDLILAADRANLNDLQRLCPEPYQAKLQLMLSFASLKTDEVPDPYYGEGDGFELVLDLLALSLGSLAEKIAKQQGEGSQLVTLVTESI